MIPLWHLRKYVPLYTSHIVSPSLLPFPISSLLIYMPLSYDHQCASHLVSLLCFPVSSILLPSYTSFLKIYCFMVMSSHLTS